MGQSEKANATDINILDEESMIKDIAERDAIIRNYQICGFLDRDDAIKKIQELRISDADIMEATAIKLAVSSTPFSQSTNEQIVEELAMQRNILQAKLIKKQLEGRQ